MGNKSTWTISAEEKVAMRAYARKLMYEVSPKLHYELRQAYADANETRVVFYTKYVLNEKNGNTGYNLLLLGVDPENPYNDVQLIDTKPYPHAIVVDLDENGRAVVEVSVGDHRGFHAPFLMYVRTENDKPYMYKLGGPGLRPVFGRELRKALNANSVRRKLVLGGPNRFDFSSRDPRKFGVKVLSYPLPNRWGPYGFYNREIDNQ